MAYVVQLEGALLTHTNRLHSILCHELIEQVLQVNLFYEVNLYHLKCVEVA